VFVCRDLGSTTSIDLDVPQGASTIARTGGWRVEVGSHLAASREQVMITVASRRRDDGHSIAARFAVAL
jgi:hypothetical protein